MGKAIAILLLLAACGHDAAPPPAPAVHASPADAAAKPASPCEGLAADYTAAVTAADQSCTSDADCGCYQGGIGTKSGCGGVASAATVTRLDGIAKQYFAAQCRLTQECGPWQCVPHCVKGACTR